MSQCHGYINIIDNIRCDNLTYELFCPIHSFQRNNGEVCVKNFSIYLDQVKQAQGKPNKIKLCKQLYDFAIYNLDFVNSYTRLRETMLDKLTEFENDWSDAKRYRDIIISSR